MTRSRDRRRSGEAIIELVLFTPLVVVPLIYVSVAVGRVAEARSQLDSATAAGARAASLARSPVAATTAAQNAVTAFLAGHETTCGNPRVETDTSDFRAGGVVAVTVRCDVDLADVVQISPVRTVTLDDRVVSPIDVYRQVTP